MTDSRIPLMGQMPNIMMPSEAMANAARAKSAMNQNALFDREMQDRDAVEAAYRDSGGDINAMMQDPRIGFETRMKVGDLQASQAKAARAEKVQDLDFMLKGAEYTAQLASAAQNQQEWDAVRDQMVEVLGEDAAQRFPAQFSPEAQAQVVNGAMSFKDKMAQQAEARKQQAEDRRYEQNERKIDQGERRIEAALSRGDGGDRSSKPIWSDRLGAFVDPATMQLKVPVGADGQAVRPAQDDKPLPASIAKQEASLAGDIALSQGVDSLMDKHITRLESGKLDLGLGANLMSNARNKVGGTLATDESRAFSELNSDLNRMRNQSLTLNKGTQTDGDAQRAWAEIDANLTDAVLVADRLKAIKGYNEAARREKAVTIDTMRQNFGKGSFFETPEGIKLMGGAAAVGLPNGVTEDDIQETMRARNMTRDQVLQRLGVQ